jgi:hypothetical protein
VGLWYLFEVQGSRVQGKEATFDGGFNFYIQVFFITKIVGAVARLFGKV